MSPAVSPNARNLPDVPIHDPRRAAMKCDGCGCQFPAREATTDSTNVGGPGGKRAYTQIVRLTLCQACAASREVTRQFIFWTVGLILGGALLGLLAQMLGIL